MPKREKAKNLQKEQPTHTPHPHHEKAPRSFHECPRSFAKTTIAHSKFLMCIDAKFPHTPICTPKFRNAPKSKVSGYLKRPSKFPPTQQSTPKFRNVPKSEVSDYLKRPSKFRDVYPSPPTDTLKFPSLQNHLSRSRKVTKRHSKFPYTHEVREFLTISHP